MNGVLPSALHVAGWKNLMRVALAGYWVTALLGAGTYFFWYIAENRSVRRAGSQKADQHARRHRVEEDRESAAQPYGGQPVRVAAPSGATSTLAATTPPSAGR